MTPGWVAALVRARLLLARRLGRERAAEVAASGSLRAGLALVAGSPYGRELRGAGTLEEARRAAAATVLWHLRVLAGWLPPGGAGLARALAGWFELANVAERLAYLAGRTRAPTPFDLGSLADAWPRVAGALSAREVRAELARSAWGDPGSDAPEEILLSMRLSWGRRLMVVAPEASDWAAGAAALLAARERFVADRWPAALAARPLPGLGSGPETASTLPDLVRILPHRAAWALRGVEDADGLWRAESAWWTRVERDAEAMARRARSGRAVVLGAVTLLAVDARRVATALEVAARGSPPRLVRELRELA